MTKERYLQLKRLCRNYSYYEDCLKDIYRAKSASLIKPEKLVWHGDHVYSVAALSDYYRRILYKIEEAAKVCGVDIREWVFKGVTEGMSYDAMKAERKLPCGRRKYYQEYKRYFVELDKMLRWVTLGQD